MKPLLTSTGSVSMGWQSRSGVEALFEGLDVMLFEVGTEVGGFEVYLATDLGKAECAVVAVSL